MRHLDPGIGLNLGVFGLFQQSKQPWFVRCVSYLHVPRRLTSAKRRTAREDCERVCFALSLRVWSAKKGIAGLEVWNLASVAQGPGPDRYLAGPLYSRLGLD